MTKDEARHFNPGLYRIVWKDKSRHSLAAVGMLHNGERWFAPTNWSSHNGEGIVSTDWELVDRITEIDYG